MLQTQVKALSATVVVLFFSVLLVGSVLVLQFFNEVPAGNETEEVLHSNELDIQAFNESIAALNTSNWVEFNTILASQAKMNTSLWAELAALQLVIEQVNFTDFVTTEAINDALVTAIRSLNASDVLVEKMTQSALQKLNASLSLAIQGLNLSEVAGEEVAQSALQKLNASLSLAIKNLNLSDVISYDQLAAAIRDLNVSDVLGEEVAQSALQTVNASLSLALKNLNASELFTDQVLRSSIQSLNLSTVFTDQQLVSAIQSLNASDLVSSEQLASAIQKLNLSVLLGEEAAQSALGQINTSLSLAIRNLNLSEILSVDQLVSAIQKLNLSVLLGEEAAQSALNQVNASLALAIKNLNASDLLEDEVLRKSIQSLNLSTVFTEHQLLSVIEALNASELLSTEQLTAAIQALNASDLVSTEQLTAALRNLNASQILDERFLFNLTQQLNHSIQSLGQQTLSEINASVTQVINTTNEKLQNLNLTEILTEGLLKQVNTSLAQAIEQLNLSEVLTTDKLQAAIVAVNLSSILGDEAVQSALNQLNASLSLAITNLNLSELLANQVLQSTIQKLNASELVDVQTLREAIADLNSTSAHLVIGSLSLPDLASTEFIGTNSQGQLVAAPLPVLSVQGTLEQVVASNDTAGQVVLQLANPLVTPGSLVVQGSTNLTGSLSATTAAFSGALYIPLIRAEFLGTDSSGKLIPNPISGTTLTIQGLVINGLTPGYVVSVNPSSNDLITFYNVSSIGGQANSLVAYTARGDLITATINATGLITANGGVCLPDLLEVPFLATDIKGNIIQSNFSLLNFTTMVIHQELTDYDFLNINVTGELRTNLLNILPLSPCELLGVESNGNVICGPQSSATTVASNSLVTYLAAYGTTGALTAAFFVATGVSGSAAASAYVGATLGGAPTSASCALGNWAVDQTGTIWICVAAGSPGTWQSVTPTVVGTSGQIAVSVSGSTVTLALANPLTTPGPISVTGDLSATGATLTGGLTGATGSFSGSLTASGLTLGTALSVSSGGTGLDTLGAEGTILESTGSAMQWVSPSTVAIVEVSGTVEQVSVTLGAGVATLALSNPLIPPGNVTIPGYLTCDNSVTFLAPLLGTSGTFAGPVSGSAGSFSSLSLDTALPVSSGGTGLDTLGAAGTILESTGSSMQWVNPSAVAVVEVTGTTEQISVNQTAGVATLALSDPLVPPGNVTIPGYLTCTDAATFLAPISGTSASFSGSLSANSASFTGSISAVGATLDGVLSVSSSAGTEGQLLASQGSSAAPQWVDPSSVAVSSIQGTPNQVTVNQTSGPVTISLANPLTTPGDLVVSGTLQVEGVLAGTSASFSSTLSADGISSSGASFTGAVSTGALTASSLTLSTPLQPSEGGTGLTELGSNGQILQSTGSEARWVNTTSVAVTSVQGTSGQITVNQDSGTATISLPNSLSIPGSVSMEALSASGATLSGGLTGTSASFSGALMAAGLTLGTPLAPTQGGTGLTALGSNGTILESNGTAMQWVSPSSVAVVDVAGTVDQVSVTQSAGTVIVALSSPLIAPGNVTVPGSLSASSLTLGTPLPPGQGGTGLTVLGASGTILESTGSVTQWVKPSAVAVVEVTGTTDQVSAAQSAGVVTLALPNPLIPPGNVTIPGYLTCNNATTFLAPISGTSASFSSTLSADGISSSGAVSTGALTASSLTLSTPLQPGQGGTGLTELGAEGTILESTGSAIQWVSPSAVAVVTVTGTTNQVSVAQSAGVATLALSNPLIPPGNVTVSDYLTCNNAATFLAPISGTTASFSGTLSADGISSSTASFTGAVSTGDLTASSLTLGTPLPPDQGGTGSDSALTEYALIYASASSQMASLGVGSSGFVLVSQGSSGPPQWSAAAASGGGVSVVQGTANQITATTSSTTVTLALANPLTTPGPATVTGGLTASSLTLTDPLQPSSGGIGALGPAGTVPQSNGTALLWTNSNGAESVTVPASLVYGEVYTLASDLTGATNDVISVFSESITSPNYGSSWRVFVSYTVNFYVNTGVTVQSYAALSSSPSSYFAPAYMFSSGSITGVTGSGYSTTDVAPSTALSISLYFEAGCNSGNVTIYPYAFTGNAQTSLQVLWVSDSSLATVSMGGLVFEDSSQIIATTTNKSVSLSLAVGPSDTVLQSTGTELVWQPFMASWQAFTTTITATTTNPTPGTGYTLNSYYMVMGKIMFVTMNFYQSTAGSAGNGTYQFSIPSGYTINTNIALLFSPSVGQMFPLGACTAWSPGGWAMSGQAMAYSSTTYIMGGATPEVAPGTVASSGAAYLYVTSANWDMGCTDISYGANLQIPIN